MVKTSLLTLTLLELKVIIIIVFVIGIEPGQPGHPCSLTRLFTDGRPTLCSHLDIPKMKMDSSRNRRWNIPSKKFGS